MTRSNFHNAPLTAVDFWCASTDHAMYKLFKQGPAAAAVHLAASGPASQFIDVQADLAQMLHMIGSSNPHEPVEFHSSVEHGSLTLAANDYALVTTPDGTVSFSKVHSLVTVRGRMYTFVTFYPRSLLQRDAFGAFYVSSATLAATRGMRQCVALSHLKVAPMWLYRELGGLMRFISKW